MNRQKNYCHTTVYREFPTLYFMGDPDAPPDPRVRLLQRALIEAGYGQNGPLSLRANGRFDRRLVAVLGELGLGNPQGTGVGPVSWARLPEAVSEGFWRRYRGGPSPAAIRKQMAAAPPHNNVVRLVT